MCKIRFLVGKARCAYLTYYAIILAVLFIHERIIVSLL